LIADWIQRAKKLNTVHTVIINLQVDTQTQNKINFDNAIELNLGVIGIIEKTRNAKSDSYLKDLRKENQLTIEKIQKENQLTIDRIQKEHQLIIEKMENKLNESLVFRDIQGLFDLVTKFRDKIIEYLKNKKLVPHDTNNWCSIKDYLNEKNSNSSIKEAVENLGFSNENRILLSFYFLLG
jgi:hypothetical protein